MSAPSRIRRIAGIAGGSLLVVLLVTAYLHASMTPPEDVDYSRTRATEGGAYRASIQPVDSIIKIGRVHAWRLDLRTAAGDPVNGAEFDLDGGMPQHGHGYPTRPRVTRALGDGGYLIEGVKFNMGGWWTMKLTVRAAEGTDSVTFNLAI